MYVIDQLQYLKILTWSRGLGEQSKINPLASMRFVFFYSPKSWSQVRILMY